MKEGPEPLKLLKGTHGLTKFLRRIAFQQFWYQKGLNGYSLARQRLMLIDLPCSFPIAESVKRITGLTISQILDMLNIAHVIFQPDEKLRTHTTVDLFANACRCDAIISSKFLTLLSLSLNEVQKKCISLSDTRIVPLDEQIVGRTPLFEKPFLHLEKIYYLYSPQLLEEAIKFWIYDLLKKDEDIGLQFSGAFGVTFEDYVRKGVKYLSLAHMEESDLKLQFPKTLVCDFLVDLSNITLLVEAKTVEMAPRIQSTQGNSELAKSFKNSVVKAYAQFYSVASSLRSQGNYCKPIHCFIVTFKELYLLDGFQAWDEFVNIGYASEYPETSFDFKILHPANIHFLNIDAWDRFVHTSRNRPETAEAIAIEATSNNWGEDLSSPTRQASSTFTFDQFLSGRVKEGIPEYLESAVEEQYDRLLNLAAKIEENIS